jgi:hypothetical protein
MYLHPKYSVALLGGLLLTVVPALAGGLKHTDSTEFDVTQMTKIGTTELAPGDYVLRGKESQAQLDILQNGRVVATIPCHWVRLDKKAEMSEVYSTGSQVTEVKFEGRLEAAKVG